MLNCEDPPLDICLVIDQTRSVGKRDYGVMMNALGEKFLPLFTISEEATHFSVVTFAQQATIRIPFNHTASSSLQQLADLIGDMSSDRLGSPTRTDRAIEVANEAFEEANGDRRHAANALVLLTDGRTHVDSKSFIGDQGVLHPIIVSIFYSVTSCFYHLTVIEM